MHLRLSLAVVLALFLFSTRHFTIGDAQLQGSDEDSTVELSEPSINAQRHLSASSDLVWRSGRYIQAKLTSDSCPVIRYMKPKSQGTIFLSVFTIYPYR